MKTGFTHSDVGINAALWIPNCPDGHCENTILQILVSTSFKMFQAEVSRRRYENIFTLGN